MVNLSPRNRLILTAGVSAAIVVVLAVALVLPQIGALGEVRAQIDRAVDESEAAKTLLEQRRQVRSQAAVTDAKLIQLAVAVPENPDLPNLIVALQDTAYDCGVVIMSVTPADPQFTEGASYAAIPVTFEVWGTWADTVDFLQRVPKLERELRTVGFVSGVLPPPGLDSANPSGLSFPPYYQVITTVRLNAYVIPSNDAAAPSNAVPTAPAE